MALKRPDLTKYLVMTLAIGQTNDHVLNATTEEELEIILTHQASRMGYVYPIIPKEEEALLVCLAKKEVYWKMATTSAPLYQLDLEGLKVAKDVRFDHYLALIQEVDKEYKSILNDPKRVTVSVGDIIIEKPYTRNKRLDNYVLPTPLIDIDKATTTTFDISINYNNLVAKEFKEANLYVCEEPIWDKYDECLNTKAKKVTVFKTHRNPYCRVKGLKSGTKYYILLEICLYNGIVSYTEIEGETANE